LPAGRLRRSLLVIAIVATHVLLVAVAAHGFVEVLKAHGPPGTNAQARKALQSAAQALTFMAFVIGLGRALLASARPSWRLPPIPDATASRLSALPWLVALVAALAWTPAEINALIDASFAAVVSHARADGALLLTALVGTVIYRLKALRADAPEAGPAGAADVGRPAGGADRRVGDRDLGAGGRRLRGAGQLPGLAADLERHRGRGLLRAVQVCRRRVHGLRVLAQQRSASGCRRASTWRRRRWTRRPRCCRA
jgi:hypothetical protein